MGLLTDPGMEGGWLATILLSHHRLLASLLYVTGVVWFMALAHNSMNHGTYFSENALLPGLVQGEFIGEARANRFLQELTKECEKYPSTLPHSWLHAKFTQLGLDTYTHNFTLNYPMAVNTSFTGRNVYGILRAVRASSTESIVVSAPYRPPVSVHSNNAPAIALMMALAHYFSEQVYWAKDIIFLVTEHEQLGTEAWLQAYHNTPAGMEGVLDYGVLPARAGPIQAAVNLEIEGNLVSQVDIRYEGLNGQLPNLDLVNLLHKLCHRENVRHTIKKRFDHNNPLSYEGWKHQLITLLSTIATQATGVPSGNHGLFHRYGIAAVTVAGERDRQRNTRRSATLMDLGKVLEGVCRSLNNLLERFHQSFFFYLLPATNRYISIGVYMPAFGTLGASLLIIALALWCSSNIKAQMVEEENKEGRQKEDENTKQSREIQESRSYSLVSCCAVAVPIHALAGVMAWCPQMLAICGSAIALSAEDSVIIGLTAFCLVLLQLPSTLTKFSSGVSSISWEVLKCIAVLELSVLVFAGALHNLSLALLVTVIYAPIVLIATPSNGRLLRWFKQLTMLLIHPLTLLIIFVFIDTWYQFPIDGAYDFLERCVSAVKRALMYSVVDSMIYGNWVYPMACSCLMPIWMMLWHVLQCPVT